jgi:hypothetical protein
LKGGPVLLEYQLAGFAALAGPLLTLQRLLALWRNGNFSPSLHRRDIKARRWLALLRASDALAAGASQRVIARELLSPEVAGPRWRILAPEARSRVQRLVRGAREMEDGGYLALLRGR